MYVLYDLCGSVRDCVNINEWGVVLLYKGIMLFLNKEPAKNSIFQKTDHFQNNVKFMKKGYHDVHPKFSEDSNEDEFGDNSIFPH